MNNRHASKNEINESASFLAAQPIINSRNFSVAQVYSRWERAAGIIGLFLCLLVVVAAVLIMAGVPPVSRDALTHHLAVPKLWIQHGGIYEIPNLVFSYYPMNVDLLYVIPLLLGNDIAPKYIHFFFGLATAWLIYGYLRKRTSLVYALLGVLIFLSTPVIIKLSISAYVDLGLIFFIWASIYFICEWQRSSFQKRHLIWAAVFCGLGIGTKYNGLLALFLLTFFVQLGFFRKRKASNERNTIKAIFASIVFVTIALMLFSPWMIRNMIWTGNPVYPLYHTVFDGENDENPDQHITMKPWLQRKLIYKETAMETALIPLRVFFQGNDDNPKYFDGKLNPMLLFFPLLAFLGFKKSDLESRSELILLGGFAIFYLLYASFIVDMRIRYISPILPPLVVLTVFGIRNVFGLLEHRPTNIRRSLNFFLISVISFFLFQNAGYTRDLFKNVDPIPYLTGKTTREEYIEKFRPEYPVIQAANQLPMDNVKIVALFVGNRRYYFDKDVDFAAEKFKYEIETPTSAQQLARSFKDDGYTHVVVGILPFKDWAKKVFQNEHLTKLNAFFNENCKPIYAKNGYALFEITPRPTIERY